MSSKLRFLALAGGTVGASVVAFMLCQRRGRQLGDYRRVRPGYGTSRFSGIGETTTKCVPATDDSEVRVCVTKPKSLGPTISEPSVACRILAKSAEADRESFYTIMLNVANKVIGIQEANRGSLTGVEVHPREIFRPAILAGAAAVIVAHNHPSGDPSPSRDDQNLTSRLKEAGELVGIPVLDHLIIGSGGCMSLAEGGRVA